MRKISLITAILTITGFISYAQSIPPGSCGILFTYDNAGNRIKQEYYCNNAGRTAQQDSTTIALNEPPTTAFQEVDALYPNPTTGIFHITFARALKNASIQLIDLNGRVLQQFKASGNKVTLDLSRASHGEYFVRINDNGQIITKKVIKAQ